MFLALQSTQPNCFLTKTLRQRRGTGNVCDENKCTKGNDSRSLFLYDPSQISRNCCGELLQSKSALRITTAQVKQGTRGWSSSKGTTCCWPWFWHSVCSGKTSGSYYWFVLTALEVQLLSASLIFHIINYLEREHSVQTRLVMEKTVWLNMRWQYKNMTTEPED